MKKYIFGGIAVLAIATVAAWNMNLNSQSNNLSEISLANVEALAGETNTSASCNGLLGWCSLDCSKCGAKLNALGSSYTHSCSN